VKILQLSKFYPPVRGGIETTTYELTEGINRQGLRADVLCANDAAVTIRERAPAGYEITRAASAGRLLSVSIAPRLLTEVRQMASRYDVIHVHMPDPLAALALRLARPQGRIVLHWHSDVVRQRLSRKLYEPLQAWLLQRADAIIATTPIYAGSSAVLQRWAKKVHVIPIGISDRRASVNAERVGALRASYPGKRIVLGLGRMTYYKGFDVLIRAARLLPDDVQVLIGGTGDLFNHYRMQIDVLGLQDRVQLLGPLSEDALLDHYAAADVFCLPSTARSEAFGVAMLEAMAMSKPIVSTDIEGSGVPWINQNGVTGLTVPVGEPGPLAFALRQLLDDRGLALAYGQAARERYEQGFHVDEMTRNVVELYRHLVTT
jgi:rhamnosyl/mannosyltransferase